MSTFPWKNLTSNKNILEDNYMLNQILYHNVTKYEIDTLPSNYIITFIRILQEFSKNLLNNNNNNNNNFNATNSTFYGNYNIEDNSSFKIKELEKEIKDKDKIIIELEGNLIDIQKKMVKLNNKYNDNMFLLKKKIKENKENLLNQQFDNFKLYMTDLINRNNYYNNNYNNNNKNLMSSSRSFYNNNNNYNNNYNKNYNSSHRFSVPSTSHTNDNQVLRRSRKMNTEKINNLNFKLRQSFSNLNKIMENNLKKSQEKKNKINNNN